MKEPIGAFDVSLCEKEIEIVLGDDMWNAPVVAQNRDGTVETQAGDGAGRASVRAYSEHDVCDEGQQDERDERQRGQYKPRENLHSSSGVDENVVALDNDFKRHQRHHGRKRERVASTYVERRAVPRADHVFALQLALVERSTVVRADVFDRIDLAADVTKQNLDRIGDNSPGRPRRNL